MSYFFRAYIKNNGKKIYLENANTNSIIFDSAKELQNSIDNNNIKDEDCVLAEMINSNGNILSTCKAFCTKV